MYCVKYFLYFYTYIYIFEIMHFLSNQYVMLFTIIVII